MLILELLGCPGPPLQIKTTLMTEPLVNSALAQFMYKNLLSPEMVSWEQSDYCKGLQYVLQPLSSSFRPKNFWFRHACVVGMNLKYNIDIDQKKPVSTVFIRENEITQKIDVCLFAFI